MTSASTADRRPVVALAMFGGLAPHLLGESYDRLHAMAAVPDVEPLERFDDDRAGDLLGVADVLLTGWLCPPITGSVLDRAPNLRLVAHAAGTVKEHVTPAVWERGIRVTSAAAANAVPVAEYTRSPTSRCSGSTRGTRSVGRTCCCHSTPATATRPWGSWVRRGLVGWSSTCCAPSISTWWSPIR
jgi:hypothetical protein